MFLGTGSTTWNDSGHFARKRMMEQVEKRLTNAQKGIPTFDSDSCDSS